MVHTIAAWCRYPYLWLMCTWAVTYMVESIYLPRYVCIVLYPVTSGNRVYRHSIYER